MAIKQFALPYKLDAAYITQGRNENFTNELVEFVKTRIAIGFAQHKTHSEVTGFIR